MVAAPREPDSISIADVEAARRRLEGVVPRTPMIKLEADCGAELWLKLECLQPVRSFKIRGAYNALALMADDELEAGVYTASAGNMALGLAWAARRRGVSCAVVVPDNAPRAKVNGIARLGAEIVKVTYDQWWEVFVTHRFAPLEPARFVHPVSDVGMMAGNGTLGLEILEDVPDVEAILVPFGGGGLSCGISAAVKATRPELPVFACEVDTAAPLAAALAAGRPVDVDRTPTFVDGIGGRAVLSEMWPVVSRLLAGSLVVHLANVEAAIRLLAARCAIVAEGAGATAVAAGLQHTASLGRMVCVVSGGNIDAGVLARILEGEQA
ncbi:MAG TPA: pyridoxal-phosphate dependent enzyme [Candidatus Dormibacteraeota bacterium]|nr:pyridoxal-phosphate dependent enzyme [Candidatus Dormibacteraeota bacterium]